MFSRLNVRTKLLVMLLPAAVGLCGLAGLGVQTRLEERDVADRARTASSLAEAGSAFVHELQAERLLAATSAADGADDSSLIAAQRDATNGAMGTVRALIDDSDSLSAGEVASLRDALGRVDGMRRAATDASNAEIVSAYGSVIDRTMAAVGRLEMLDGSGGSAAVSRRWLAEGIEAESAAAATSSGLFADVTSVEQEAVVDETQEILDRATLFFDTFAEYAGSTGVDQLSEARAESGSDVADGAFDDLSGTGAADALAGIEPATWPGMVDNRLTPLVALERTSFRADVAELTAAADAADSTAVYFAAGAAGSCLLVLLLAFGVSRQITNSLGRLARSAQEISTDQVPALVQSLKSGATTGVTFTKVDVEDGDEFAAVAHALNDLGEAMVTVSTEQQQSLRKGISDIFVNLARRNQTLLDRQIQFIDRLEANEQDPDQLENLFRLDHLATRMRRNAESLLVLAGAEAPRRRTRQVDITDVVRVAVGEVEDFARISLVAIEDAETIGGAAVDIAHLLSELMENGAQYSPPERTVDVVGHRSVDGGYNVSITDHGVGMTIDRIEQANRLLASPPPVGLALTRSLGFVVAGTLAQRHGITVRLTPSPSAGVTAEIAIPARLLVPVVAPEPVAPEPTISVVPEILVRRESDAGIGGWTADGEFVPAGREPLGGQPLPKRGAPEPVAFAPMAEPAAFVPLTVEPLADAGTPPPYVPPVLEPAVAWAPEHTPDHLPEAPSPAKLTDMLPEGPAFEQGLYSLLDREAPGADTSDAPGAAGPESAGPGTVDGAPTLRSGEFESAAPAAPPAFPEPDPAITPESTGDPFASRHHELPPVWADTPPLWDATPPVWDEGPPAFVDGPALPQRSPGASPSVPNQDDVHRITAPTRGAEGVRSVLSRYRDGLGSGRTEPDGDDGRPDPHEESAR